jgi:hypothetical protein
VRALIGLDVLESSLGIAHGVQLFSRGTAVRGAPCFSCHVILLSDGGNEMACIYFTESEFKSQGKTISGW